MEDDRERAYRIEKRPPEGAYGNIIAVSLAITFSCAWGSLGSFGLMFNDFITSCGGESRAVIIVIGSFTSALSFGGLFASIAFKKFSIRSVGICGAILYTIGSFLTIFVTSVEHLIISYGIMQGGAIGIMVPVSYTTFNSYFIRRRVLMMSFTQTLIGVGTMVYPVIVHFLMENYGFGGMTLLIAAINCHAIVGMLAMHPVEWHYEIIKTPADETKPSLNSNEISKNDRDLDVINRNHGTNNDVIVEQNRKDEHEKSPEQFENYDGFDPTQRRVSSISVTGIGGIIVSDIPELMKRDSIWKKIANFLDLSLLKDFVYLNIALGISFAQCSDGSFFTLQPMYMYQMGFSKAEAAMVVASGAAADLVSRIFVTVMSLCIEVKARYIYLSGVILTILLRFVFLVITEFTGMIVITVIMSIVRTWLHLPVPLVFADYLPPERFSSGYGQFMFMQGNFYFLVGPLAGWIRDHYQSYVICFHSLTFIMALCAIPWTIEIIWFRIYPRNNCDKIENIHTVSS